MTCSRHKFVPCFGLIHLNAAKDKLILFKPFWFHWKRNEHARLKLPIHHLALLTSKDDLDLTLRWDLDRKHSLTSINNFPSNVKKWLEGSNYPRWKLFRPADIFFQMKSVQFSFSFMLRTHTKVSDRRPQVGYGVLKLHLFFDSMQHAISETSVATCKLIPRATNA